MTHEQARDLRRPEDWAEDAIESIRERSRYDRNYSIEISLQDDIVVDGSVLCYPHRTVIVIESLAYRDGSDLPNDVYPRGEIVDAVQDKLDSLGMIDNPDIDLDWRA
jgi:hypothetical protein